MKILVELWMQFIKQWEENANAGKPEFYDFMQWVSENHFGPWV